MHTLDFAVLGGGEFTLASEVLSRIHPSGLLKKKKLLLNKIDQLWIKYFFLEKKCESSIFWRENLFYSGNTNYLTEITLLIVDMKEIESKYFSLFFRRGICGIIGEKTFFVMNQSFRCVKNSFLQEPIFIQFQHL